MKKCCIVFLIVAIIILSGFGLNLNQKDVKTEFLRIHIRADSNLDADQSVKYLVKDAVVEYLTPLIAECDTFEKAKVLLTDNLKGITETANGVLKQNGFDYTASAGVKRENFPTRCYGDLVLENGFYDALIINLGSGTGDNWWCVVYPPLCFVQDSSPLVYKSKIKSIIDDFYKKENV